MHRPIFNRLSKGDIAIILIPNKYILVAFTGTLRESFGCIHIFHPFIITFYDDIRNIVRLCTVGVEAEKWSDRALSMCSWLTLLSVNALGFSQKSSTGCKLWGSFVLVLCKCCRSWTMCHWAVAIPRVKHLVTSDAVRPVRIFKTPFWMAFYESRRHWGETCDTKVLDKLPVRMVFLSITFAF